MGMLVPFVVTKYSVVLVDGHLPVLLMKAAEVNVPMTISSYEGQCIVYFLSDGDLDPRSPASGLKEVFALSGISLVKIVIDGLGDDDENAVAQFISSMVIKKGDEKEVSLPIFPGDAIMLALTLGAPMFIDEMVVMRATEGEPAQRLISFLEETAPIALET